MVGELKGDSSCAHSLSTPLKDQKCNKVSGKDASRQGNGIGKKLNVKALLQDHFPKKGATFLGALGKA